MDRLSSSEEKDPGAGLDTRRTTLLGVITDAISPVDAPFGREESDAMSVASLDGVDRRHARRGRMGKTSRALVISFDLCDGIHL